MAKVLVSESNLTSIANAIRTMSGTNIGYTPAQMAPAILAIPVGGGGESWEINITQSAHQTITVDADIYKLGQTSSFTIGGATDIPEIGAVVTSDAGYTAGTASVQRSGSTFSVSATAATLTNYTITITQSANQTITVTCNGVSYTTSFTAHYGDTWTATIVADEDYTAGTLSASSGTVNGNVTISASPATSQVTPVGGYIGLAILTAGSYTFYAGTENETTLGGYASNDFTQLGTFTVGTQGSFASIQFPTTLALLGDTDLAILVFSSADFAGFVSSLEEQPQHLYASVFYLDENASNTNDGVTPIVLNNDLTTGASVIQTDFNEGTATAYLRYNSDANIPAADKTISVGHCYYIALSTAETSASEFAAFWKNNGAIRNKSR